MEGFLWEKEDFLWQLKVLRFWVVLVKICSWNIYVNLLNIWYILAFN